MRMECISHIFPLMFKCCHVERERVGERDTQTWSAGRMVHSCLPYVVYTRLVTEECMCTHMNVSYGQAQVPLRHVPLPSLCIQQALNLSDSYVIQASAQMSLLQKDLSWLLQQICGKSVFNPIPLCIYAFCNAPSFIKKWSLLPLSLNLGWLSKFTLTNRMQPKSQSVSYKPQGALLASLIPSEPCPYHINKPRLACGMMRTTWPSHLVISADSQTCELKLFHTSQLPAGPLPDCKFISEPKQDQFYQV